MTSMYQAGNLQIGSGGIDMKDFNVSGFDNVITDGEMDVGDVTVRTASSLVAWSNRGT